MKKIIIYSITISLTLFACYYVNKRYRADICYEKSRELVVEGKYDAAFSKINCALELNSKEPHYYIARAKIFLLLDSPNLMERKVHALRDLLTAEKLSPDNLVIKRNSIPIYYFLAIKDYSKPPDELNIDPQFLGITAAYFDKVKIAYSSDVGVVSLISRYESKLMLEQGYVKSIDLINRLRPELLDWYVTW